MNETKEVPVADNALQGAVNGLVCAFALLIDVLETNGALKPQQFESVLSAVLRQPGVNRDDPDVATLHQLMNLLQMPEKPPLTVIAGGKV